MLDLRTPSDDPSRLQTRVETTTRSSLTPERRATRSPTRTTRSSSSTSSSSLDSEPDAPRLVEAVSCFSYGLFELDHSQSKILARFSLPDYLNVPLVASREKVSRLQSSGRRVPSRVQTALAVWRVPSPVRPTLHLSTSLPLPPIAPSAPSEGPSVLTTADTTHVMSGRPFNKPTGEVSATEPTSPASAIAQDAPTASASNSIGPTSQRVEAGMDVIEKGDAMEGVVEGDEKGMTEPPATVAAPEITYVPSPPDLPPPRSSES